MILNSISRSVVKSYTNSGPVPGLYTTQSPYYSSVNEICDKKYFSLDLPQPSAEHINALPDIDTEVLPLFKRDGSQPKSRVSLLLPFFAQHLTDAVFQSKNEFETDAPHEIILNQIYSNTSDGLACLRSGEKGKLKTRVVSVNGADAEFPPQLCEKSAAGEWKVKDEFAGLNYAKNPEKIITLLDHYKGREEAICAVGLYQGNLTLGNYALTCLLIREHNRLCDEVYDELKACSKPHDDEAVFRVASMVNIISYMRVVVEDYINAFAGMKVFQFDTHSFFYETQAWCRSSPIPYHFNILYRLHTMMPDQLEAFPDLGFSAYLANNNLVEETGLGATFAAASKQAACRVSLQNTHPDLLPAEAAMLHKARKVLAPYAEYRKLEGLDNTQGFNLFDSKVRKKIRDIYDDDFSKVDYALGIYAEWPASGILEKIGVKKRSFLSETLMKSIAKHAFRHIYSNPLMRREFLNANVLTKVGWNTIQNTHTAADIIKRNVPEMGNNAKQLDISMAAPEHR